MAALFCIFRALVGAFFSFSRPLWLRFFIFRALVAAFFPRLFKAALLGSGPLFRAPAAEDSREFFFICVVFSHCFQADTGWSQLC